MDIGIPAPIDRRRSLSNGEHCRLGRCLENGSKEQRECDEQNVQMSNEKSGARDEKRRENGGRRERGEREEEKERREETEKEREGDGKREEKESGREREEPALYGEKG
ncbi:hypothetical protein TNCV_737221 [Trichonephila clavipes]|nr:hypothetical protein TNCV_737221 [Trichonephila clavipes]